MRRCRRDRWEPARNVLLLLLLACPLALVGHDTAWAQDVSGPLTTDTLWAAGSGPYHVTGKDLTVAEGATLTIEPGVRVELDANRSIVIQGQLVARGEVNTPIVFTGTDSGSGPASWESLIFKDSAVDATYEILDDYLSGSIVSGCVLEYGQKAIVLESASPYIAHNLFQHNQTPFIPSPSGGAAISVEKGSVPRIFANEFADNHADGFAYGGAIYVLEADPIIQDNLFHGNTAIYGGALGAEIIASPIVGNRFEGNEATGTDGGAASLVSSTSAFLNNTLIGNTAATDGGGLHVCTTCFPHSNPFVLDNTIVDNVSTSTEPSEHAGGVGAAYLRAFSNNNLHGNTRDGQPSDFGWFHLLSEGYPEWAQNIDLTGNYWATTDTSALEATLYDGADSSLFGTATVSSPLPTEVVAAQTRVTLTTRKIRYQDVGDPMPLFLTLYNPGPARSVELALIVQYEGSPPTDFLPALAFPGAAQRNGLTLLDLPENSVFFGAVSTSEYVVASSQSGTWSAALFEPQTGALIGQLSTIHFELGEAVQ